MSSTDVVDPELIITEPPLATTGKESQQQATEIQHNGEEHHNKHQHANFSRAFGNMLRRSKRLMSGKRRTQDPNTIPENQPIKTEEKPSAGEQVNGTNGHDDSKDSVDTSFAEQSSFEEPGSPRGRKQSQTFYGSEKQVMRDGRRIKEIEVTGEQPDEVDMKKQKKLQRRKSIDKEQLNVPCRSLGKADHEGWLYKKAGGHGIVPVSWKKFWVVIKTGKLYCYKTSFNIAADYLLTINDFNVDNVAEKKKSHAFHLKPKEEDRKISVFACETEPELNQWIEVIHKVNDGIDLTQPEDSLVPDYEDHKRLKPKDDTSGRKHRPSSTAFQATEYEETTGLPSGFGARTQSSSQPRVRKMSAGTGPSSVLSVGSMFHPLDEAQDAGTPTNEEDTQLKDLLFKEVVVETTEEQPDIVVNGEASPTEEKPSQEAEVAEVKTESKSTDADKIMKEIEDEAKKVAEVQSSETPVVVAQPEAQVVAPETPAEEPEAPVAVVVSEPEAPVAIVIAEPEAPVVVAEPEAPAAVAESEAPVTVAAPEAPVAVAEPEAPVAVAEPEALVAVVEPEAPVAVAEPEAPVAVAEPEAPVAVAEPEAPVAVAEPEAPVAVVIAEPEAPVAVAEPEALVAVAEPEAPVAVAEPEAPVAVAEPEAPVAVAEPEAPVAVAEPEAPVAVAEPEAPVAVAESEAPVAVAESEAPVAVAESEAPVAVAEPEAPVVVAEPEAPVAVAESEAPVTVAAPEAPVAVAESEAPVVVSEPEAPVAVAEPEAPVAVAEPEAPVAVAEPEAPVTVAESEAPVVVAEPEAPVVVAESEAPVVVAEPEAPVAVAEPEAPVAVAEPEAPVVAAEPAVPVAITEPEAPASSESAAVVESQANVEKIDNEIKSDSKNVEPSPASSTEDIDELAIPTIDSGNSSLMDDINLELATSTTKTDTVESQQNGSAVPSQ